MTNWFSEEELERIKQFASSPAYSRSPSMLLPTDDREESAPDSTPETVPETDSQLDASADDDTDRDER